MPLRARQTSRNKTFRHIRGEKNLSSVLVSNGYPFSFLQKLTKTGKPNNSAKRASEFKATAVLPFVKGLSQQLRRCLQKQGVRAVFKSETTLRSQLVRLKDAVDPTKQDGVVYRIPCDCGKVYIRETGRPMHDRVKEHDRDIRLALTRPPFQSMPTTPDTSHSGTK